MPASSSSLEPRLESWNLSDDVRVCPSSSSRFRSPELVGFQVEEASSLRSGGREFRLVLGDSGLLAVLEPGFDGVDDEVLLLSEEVGDGDEVEVGEMRRSAGSRAVSVDERVQEPTSDLDAVGDLLRGRKESYVSFEIRTRKGYISREILTVKVIPCDPAAWIISTICRSMGIEVETSTAGSKRVVLGTASSSEKIV